MRQWIVFSKKEWMEEFRTGKFLLLLIIFTVFGMMNPATAKLTPWLMETMSEQLAEAGMIVGQVEVDAMTSWTQFFKNLPVELLVVTVMLSGILTAEYQKGTLLPIVTKGMDRWKIVAAKGTVIFLTWTVGYTLTFGITYAYNAYFWEDQKAMHLLFSIFCVYLFGVWILSIMLVVSTFLRSQATVLLTTGIVFACVYILGMLPDIKNIVPFHLMQVNDLLTGAAKVGDYHVSIVITSILIILHVATAIVCFNRRTDLLCS